MEQSMHNCTIDIYSRDLVIASFNSYLYRIVFSVQLISILEIW